MIDLERLYFYDITKHRVFSRQEEQEAFRKLARKKAAFRRLLFQVPLVQEEVFRLEEEVTAGTGNVLSLLSGENGKVKEDLKSDFSSAVRKAREMLTAGIPSLQRTKASDLLARLPWDEPALSRFGSLVAQWCAQPELHGSTGEAMRRCCRALNRLWAHIQAQKEMIVGANLRLVVKMARCFRNRGVDLFDLIQEGSAGLLRAVDKFEYRRGVKFSTYASWWIYQSLNRAITEQSQPIRISVRFGDELARQHKAHQDLSHLLGRRPTVDELAESLKMPVAEVAEIHCLARQVKNPVSLDAPLGDEGAAVGDLVEDETFLNPVQHVLREEVAEKIYRALAVLTPREEKVIRMRFGIGESAEYTLEEVGDYFGLSRERIRQIERDAIEKLRHPVGKELFEDSSVN